MKYKANSVKRNNLYWFFRSFFISFTIVFCCLTLIFGFAYCRAVTQKNITGESSKMLEVNQNGVYFWGNKIF